MAMLGYAMLALKLKLMNFQTSLNIYTNQCRVDVIETFRTLLTKWKVWKSASNSPGTW